MSKDYRKHTRRDRGALWGALIILLSFPAVAGAVSSGWFIDPYRYHVSAHGAIPCQDCHGVLSEQERHPDPANIGKGLGDLFSSADCEQCHDEVFNALDEGRHGSKTHVNPENYADCRRCHNVHYALGKERRAELDPKRSLRAQCGACHELEKELPPPPPDTETCYACHVFKPSEGEALDPRLEKFCFYCHGLNTGKEFRQEGDVTPLISEEQYASTPHHNLSCMICHPDSARYPHTQQKTGSCVQCHAPHDEKAIGAYHAEVACQTCHLSGAQPVRDPGLFRIGWELPRSDKPLDVHNMIITDRDQVCRRCHAAGSKVGATAMILPAKSVICMPCHTATFSIGDTTTIVTLIIFIFGVVAALSFWLTGTVADSDEGGFGAKLGRSIKSIFGAIFSVRLGAILEALFLDGLFLRRLYRESPIRWLIHALIYYPFIIRFVWGIIALLGSLWRPSNRAIQDMLNVNDPLTAFVFDFTGVCVILGIVLAIVRGVTRKSPVPEGMGQDRIAQGLLGGVIILGFILEGMRIAMTQVPPEMAHYAFVGYAISNLFTPGALTGVYGYMWYLHAIVWAAFVCYLPFSRMFHILLTPLVLAMNAATKHGHE